MILFSTVFKWRRSLFYYIQVLKHRLTIRRLLLEMLHSQGEVSIDSWRFSCLALTIAREGGVSVIFLVVLDDSRLVEVAAISWCASSASFNWEGWCTDWVLLLLTDIAHSCTSATPLLPSAACRLFWVGVENWDFHHFRVWVFLKCRHDLKLAWTSFEDG